MAFLGFGRVGGLRRQLEQEKTRTTNLKRMYAAAQNNRLTSDWISQATSADSEVRGSIRMLRNRARQLVRDSDFAKSALRAVKNNVVGTGIKVQAQVRMQRGGRLGRGGQRTILKKSSSRWGLAPSVVTSAAS
jgi:capsid protein